MPTKITIAVSDKATQVKRSLPRGLGQYIVSNLLEAFGEALEKDRLLIYDAFEKNIVIKRKPTEGDKEDE